jgi:hypothetical protein
MKTSYNLNITRIEKLLLFIEAMTFFVSVGIIIVPILMFKGIKTAFEFCWYVTEPKLL